MAFRNLVIVNLNLPLFFLKFNFMEISIRCRIGCSAEWQGGERTDAVCILSALIHLLVVYYFAR